MKTEDELRDDQIAKLISINRDRFIDIYPEEGPENPVPEDTHCIVIFRDAHGWLEINKTEEMGLEALIASEWIKYEDLIS